MFDGLGSKPPTTQNLHLWLRARVSHDRVSPATLQLERCYASRFFEWCITMGYMDRNPLKSIPGVPVPVFTNRAAITPEQYGALKDAARRTGSGLADPITIGWYTGARLVDIAYMQWSAVNWTAPCWEFVPRKTRTSGRRVTAPLFGELLSLLHELQKLAAPDAVYVFPYLQLGHERQDGTIQRIFRTVRDSAGLPKNITFHCLRHTRMTRMLNSDNPIDLITAANLLGLSSVDTLRKYNHSTPQNLAKAMSL